MLQKSLLTLLLFFSINSSFAQYYQQYFDGADTSLTNSIIVKFDPDTANIWQIGRPQKTIFNSAATLPNALVTDTIHYYPVNNISRFTITIHPWINYGILALQWKQKIDLDSGYDGAIVEYSIDTGHTWHNVFYNPAVYNYYGYNSANKDTLSTGEYALSGTDTSWRDIWLCFDNSYLSLSDSVAFRFTLKTDSVNNNKEGWLIDNMIAHITGIHTVKTTAKNDYVRIYPTVTDGIVNIEAEKLQQFHIIESMQLMDNEGRIVETFGKSPVKYYINIGNHPNGVYYLKINTNIKTTTCRLVLRK